MPLWNPQNTSDPDTEDEGGMDLMGEGSAGGIGGRRAAPSGGVSKVRKARGGSSGGRKRGGGGAAVTKIDDDDLANMDPKKARRILKNREVPGA